MMDDGGHNIVPQLAIFTILKETFDATTDAISRSLSRMAGLLPLCNTMHRTASSTSGILDAG